MSWSFAVRGGYDVFFNRDELDTRAEETPPRLATTVDGDLHFLAPRDGDHDGTWLLVNDAGLTLCLLNDYGCPWRPSGPEPRLSRGHVLLACAAAESCADVAAMLCAQSLERALPFHVLAFSLREPVRLWHWEGTELEERAAPADPAVYSSSSFATREVVAARRARLATFARDPAQPTPPELAAFHQQHDASAGAHSVLMRRPDAATRSIIHLRVDATAACLDYTRVLWPKAPDLSLPCHETRSDTLALAPREFSALAGCHTRDTTP